MLSEKQVSDGVSALLGQLNKDKSKLFLDEPELIYLRFKVKKVADQKKYIRLNLPHSLHHGTRDVCLFVKDLDSEDRDYDKTVRHFQEILDNAGVKGISKIIPLKALRTDYCDEEAKAGLSQSYDLYLADDRIFPFLHRLLGHSFFCRLRSVPVLANMRSKRLKEHLERLIHNSRCLIDRRLNCVAIVAHAQMTQKEIAENVIKACKKIMRLVPGGPNNIFMFELKIGMEGIIPIPIYVSFESADKVVLHKIKNRELETITDEITTVQGALVSVRPDGIVKIVKKAPEKRKLDAGSDSTETEQKTKKKKQGNDLTEDEEMAVSEPVFEKRYDGKRPMDMIWERRRNMNLVKVNRLVAGIKTPLKTGTNSKFRKNRKVTKTKSSLSTAWKVSTQKTEAEEGGNNAVQSPSEKQQGTRVRGKKKKVNKQEKQKNFNEMVKSGKVGKGKLKTSKKKVKQTKTN